MAEPMGEAAGTHRPDRRNRKTACVVVSPAARAMDLLTRRARFQERRGHGEPALVRARARRISAASTSRNLAFYGRALSDFALTKLLLQGRRNRRSRCEPPARARTFCRIFEEISARTFGGGRARLARRGCVRREGLRRGAAVLH